MQKIVGEKEYRIFGPPGTGKTTYLAKQIERAVEKTQDVMVCSFTKAAALELVGRKLPIPRFRIGTLHSFCYRALGHPEIAETTKWIKVYNETRPKAELKLSEGRSLDDPYGSSPTGKTEEDRLLSSYSKLRTQLKKLELAPKNVISFAQRWEAFKTKHNLMDFTDLILVAIDAVPQPTFAVRVAFFDEVQDFSPAELKLVRKWSEHFERVLLAGDDDQCQPAGTMVLLECGETKPIEDLNQKKDRVVAYDRRCSYLVGFKKGFKFTKSSRFHRGPIYHVSTQFFNSRATMQHRWLVKFSPRAIFLYVVYLMRRGLWWRVGRCKLLRSDGTLHLGTRAHIEKADAAWILLATESKEEAWIEENRVAIEYGIPQTIFDVHTQNTFIKQRLVNKLFGNTLDLMDLTERAHACLSEYSCGLEYPFWSKEKAYARRGGKSILVLESCNLISDYMKVPVMEGLTKNTHWETIRVKTTPFQGRIYSLDVDKHHTYVADNLVTHNSIYYFRGSTPDAFLDPPLPPEQIRNLTQSYRLPQRIKDYSEEIVTRVGRRQPKKFAAKDGVEGEVLRIHSTTWHPHRAIDLAYEFSQADETSMILVTCGYALNTIVAVLRDRGILFHNPYRANGQWNPCRGGVDRLRAFLTDDVATYGTLTKPPTWFTVNRWFECLDSKKAKLKRGTKNSVANFAKDKAVMNLVLTPDDWDALGIQNPNGNIDWLRENLLKGRKEHFAYALRIAKNRGTRTLTEQPKIIVGTIHSVKGGEADNVFVFPDLSPAAIQETQNKDRVENRIIQDMLRRLWYVACTRAKKRLFLCDPTSLEYSIRRFV